MTVVVAVLVGGCVEVRTAGTGGGGGAVAIVVVTTGTGGCPITSFISMS